MAINGRGRPNKEQARQADVVRTWLNHIAQYEKQFKTWEVRSQKIVDKYRDENRKANDQRSKFNILWANVQTLKPAIYSRVPQPDVSRRFQDQDPIGRIAGQILERALTYETQHYSDFRETMDSCVDDQLLPGRGVAWARYEPHILAKKQGLPEDGSEVTEDVDEADESLDYECAPCDYVHWRDFGHCQARTWEEVPGVWRKVYMTREQCVERFGEEGKDIPLDSIPEDQKGKEVSQQNQRALIIEIWDKPGNCVIWLSKSMSKVLDEREVDGEDGSPPQFEGFWPCPKPLYATMTNESLIPVPDYSQYQDQAISLDTLADRIDGLINMLQLKGVYNDEFKPLARLFTEGQNGTLLPIKNFAAFAEKNGLAGAIDIVDIKPIAEALDIAYRAFGQQMQHIYDLTGIADIIRGQSEASETATAQQIKGQYAGLRLNARKTVVTRFASQLIQFKAQIMCSKFDPRTMLKMAAAEQLLISDSDVLAAAPQLGQAPPPQPQMPGQPPAPPAPPPIAQMPKEAKQQVVFDAAIKLLKEGNPLRSFRIEVSADSLAQMDEQQEKTDRIEFAKAIGEFLERAIPAAAQSPQMAPVLMEILKFTAAAFKAGKALEGVIDEAADKIKEAAKNPPPPKPDPDMAKVQMQAQAKQAELQADQQRSQVELQMEQQRMQMEAQMRNQEQQNQAAIEQHRNQMEAARAQQQAMMDQAFARFEAILKAKTAIEVAEIGAQATLDSAQVSAANQATQ